MKNVRDGVCKSIPAKPIDLTDIVQKWRVAGDRVPEQQVELQTSNGLGLGPNEWRRLATTQKRGEHMNRPLQCATSATIFAKYGQPKFPF
jgi:hypothetical protein